MVQQDCLSFIAAYVDKEYLYAVNIKDNFFFRAERNNNYRVEILGILNGFQNGYAGKICGVYRYENFLFLLADYTCEIVKYNFLEKKFSYYNPNQKSDVFGKVRGACQVGDDVWIFQDALKKTCCIFSLKKCSYHFFELDISNLLKKTELKRKSLDIKENVYLVDNKIWRCIPGSNYIYNIDVESKELEIFEIPLDIDIFTINYNGKFFILLSMFGDCIAFWDKDIGIVSVKNINYGEKKFKAFRNVFFEKGNYLLIPGDYDKVKLWSEETGINVNFKLPLQFERINESQGTFSNYFRDNNTVLLFPFAGNGLVEIDLETGESKFYSLCISKEEYVRFRICEEKIIFEGNRLCVEAYISAIKKLHHVTEEMCRSVGEAGFKIMKEMM